MDFIRYFKIKKLLRQSHFIEAFAIDQYSQYINLSWVYYRLGMYKASLDAPYHTLDFYTLFSKTISASYLGKREAVLKYILLLKKKYPNKLSNLVLPLATYYPECAMELLLFIQDKKSPIFFALHAHIYGKKLTLEKYGITLRQKNVDNENFTFLFSNITISEHSQKIDQFNKILSNYNLRNIFLKTSSSTFKVSNLQSENQLIEGEDFPLVSILVPAFNVEGRIQSCIDSLINQDYPNIEIIIVDDASTDSTVQVIQQLSEKYTQVKAIYLPVNVGPFVAKNVAITIANGEFVTTQDADDWAHPQRIINQIQPLLYHPDLVATTCNWVRLDDSGDFYAKQFIPFIRFNPSSPLFRKSKILEQTGCWHPVRMAADTEFIERLKLVFGKDKIFAVKQPLVVGAHRTNSLMTSEITGNFENKISNTRLDYWEAWRFWHIQQLRLSLIPRMSDLLNDSELFDVPVSMKNSIENMEVIQKFIKNGYSL